MIYDAFCLIGAIAFGQAADASAAVEKADRKLVGGWNSNRFDENVKLLVTVTQLSLGEPVVAPSSECSILVCLLDGTKLSEFLAERNTDIKTFIQAFNHHLR
jgi:hypothetical protein